MTKRLGMFLGLGFVGVVLLLTGLAWDAVVHANDASLAAREGIFTLRNPGHVFLGLGIGMVLMSLIGGCDTLLASAASGRWARPGVRNAFLAVSTVVVLSAAAVTSWAGQAGHDQPSGAHDGSGQLAASVDGSHDEPEGSPPAAGTAHAEAVSGPSRTAAEESPAGADAGSHDTHTSTSIVQDRVADRPAAGKSSAAAGAHGHDAAGTGGTGPEGSAGPNGSTPASGPGAQKSADHPHEQAPAGGSPASPSPSPADGPQGTWAEMRYGPFALPPAGAGGDADFANIALPSLPKPCSNCFVQELVPDLVYADGTSANLDTGLMLHHAVLFEAGRQDPTCGPDQPFPGKLGLRFFASGNERTGGSFPPGFGYYVDRGNWSGIFQVMNHSAEPKTVFFQVRMRWSDAAAGGVRPLTPVWLDMNNCRTSEYAVPAGPSSSHWTWTSNLTGRIVSTAGHVHDGGVRTTLSNQTSGQHICTSWAGRGRKAAYQGSIESMSGCTWDRVGTVQKGEVLDLESVYDSAKPVPKAMGIMMAFVYETADLAAGTPAPPEVRGQIPPPESTPPPSGNNHH